MRAASTPSVDTNFVLDAATPEKPGWLFRPDTEPEYVIRVACDVDATV